MENKQLYELKRNKETIYRVKKEGQSIIYIYMDSFIYLFILQNYLHYMIGGKDKFNYVPVSVFPPL